MAASCSELVQLAVCVSSLFLVAHRSSELAHHAGVDCAYEGEDQGYEYYEDLKGRSRCFFYLSEDRQFVLGSNNCQCADKIDKQIDQDDEDCDEPSVALVAGQVVEYFRCLL